MTRSKALTICRSVRMKTQWAMDFDYLHKLSDEHVRYLADFCDLHYHGSPSRCEVIQITTGLRKESYRRNNNAESDVFTKTGREGTEFIDSTVNLNVEDYIIEFIDKKYI